MAKKRASPRSSVGPAPADLPSGKSTREVVASTSSSESKAKSGSNHPESNATASENEIQRRAYLKWEAAGKPQGQDARFWLEAQEELLRE